AKSITSLIVGKAFLSSKNVLIIDSFSSKLNSPLNNVGCSLTLRNSFRFLMNILREDVSSPFFSYIFSSLRASSNLFNVLFSITIQFYELFLSLNFGMIQLLHNADIQ